MELSGARRRARRPTAVLIAACWLAVLLGLAAGGCGTAGDQALNGATLEPPPRLGALSLPDYGRAAGRRTALRPPPAQLRLIYFGYTYCPDVCPTTMADLRGALSDLPPEQRARVSVGMVTVDPRRDTGPVLSAYLANFFPASRTHAYRTTDARLLRRAERRFGASHRLGKAGPDGSYEVAHTAQLYAVDPDGSVVVQWGFGTAPEDIASDLHRLLAGERED